MHGHGETGVHGLLRGTGPVGQQAVHQGDDEAEDVGKDGVDLKAHTDTTGE